MMHVTMKQAAEILDTTTWETRKLVEQGALVDISPRAKDDCKHFRQFDLAAVKRLAAERKALRVASRANGASHDTPGSPVNVTAKLLQLERQIADLQRTMGNCEAMLETLSKVWG